MAIRPWQAQLDLDSEPLLYSNQSNPSRRLMDFLLFPTVAVGPGHPAMMILTTVSCPCFSGFFSLSSCLQGLDCSTRCLGICRTRHFQSLTLRDDDPACPGPAPTDPCLRTRASSVLLKRRERVDDDIDIDINININIVEAITDVY